MLYLGAIMIGGLLGIFCCLDESVFDRELVQEWTEEVKNAALHYLVKTNTKLTSVQTPVTKL